MIRNWRPVAVAARVIALAVCFAATSQSRAENVDLSTVPDRTSVQLTIYNSEDITLVRETRTLSFKPGGNPLQFSWANTLIDPTSVELRFLDHADQLQVLDTTFPHAKPQMLYWNVESKFDGQAQVEITYFTSGITWSADYVCLANQDETQMGLEGFVRVYNNSGEEYEDAQVRLVVGTINLIEKIAQLAQISPEDVSRLSDLNGAEYRNRAMHWYLERADAAKDGKMDAENALEEKEIIKEGLSEYFIYTIEGTETIQNGWSKRMRSFEGQTVPFKIQYRYRPEEYGDQLVRMYLLTNDKTSKLGTTPLPDGMVRVFRDNGRDGLSYLTTQPIKYVPIGDKIELNLGQDPEVVFELIKRRVSRDDLWMLLNGTNTFKRLDGKMELDENSSVAGWDDHALFTQRVRNYSKQTIDLEIRRAFDGDILFRSNLDAKNHDYRTVQFTAQVEGGARADLNFELIQHQGRNARQNHVVVEPAPQR